jgi:hypothetical protein
LEVLTNVLEELSTSIFRLELLNPLNNKLYRKSEMISPENRIGQSEPRDGKSPEQTEFKGQGFPWKGTFSGRVSWNKMKKHESRVGAHKVLLLR